MLDGGHKYSAHVARWCCGTAAWLSGGDDGQISSTCRSPPRLLIRVGSFSSCASPVPQQTDGVQERHCIIFGRKEARACCQHTPRERRDNQPGVRQLIILQTYLFECNKQSDRQEWSGWMRNCGWTGTACLVSLILMAFSFHYSRSACLVHHSTTTVEIAESGYDETIFGITRDLCLQVTE